MIEIDKDDILTTSISSTQIKSYNYYSNYANDDVYYTYDTTLISAINTNEIGISIDMNLILANIEQTCLMCWACLEKDPDCAKYFTYGVNNTLKSLLTSSDNIKYTLGVNIWKKLNPII
jgi:hypothetical protein